jgi:hypothetical protein
MVPAAGGPTIGVCSLDDGVSRVLDLWRLREALTGEGQAEALEAARALVERVAVAAQDGAGRPPATEPIGELKAMLALAGIPPQARKEQTPCTDFLGLAADAPCPPCWRRRQWRTARRRIRGGAVVSSAPPPPAW